MGLLLLVGLIWMLLFLSLVECFDYRRPWSTKLTYKFRVKDNSIFRKIIKFKDKGKNICNYFKIVPFYVYLLLAILSLILLFVDIFANGFITNNVPEEVFTIISLCILGVSILYFLIVVIWWEIVDYREFKSNKRKKEELKQLRRLIKENNKKNKK